jgi:SAM-dependent methyltransferase
MTEEDRRRWDTRYAEDGLAPVRDPIAPPIFAPFEDLFPTEGRALEVACGRGKAALWLASRGMDVYGVDVSPTAILLARELLSRSGYAERARFEVFDLDNGLPDGPPVELLLCYNFRDVRLDQPMMERLAPRGLLAIATLSEVGAGPGAFRARPGELRHAFGKLEVLVEGERDGKAWLVGRRR